MNIFSPFNTRYAKSVERLKERARAAEKRHDALIGSLKPHLEEWGIDEKTVGNLETPQPELFAHLRPRAVVDRVSVPADAAQATLNRTLENLSIELARLQKNLSPSSGFTELLSLARDPLKRVHDQLHEVENLTPNALFKTVFTTHHLDVLNDFYRLHHYCRLDFQAFDRMDANSRLIEDLESELSTALYAIFGMEVISVRLFRDHFDPEQYRVAEIPTLTRFADARGEVRHRIHQLQPGVIYDLAEAGFRCPRYGFNHLPKILYKNQP